MQLAIIDSSNVIHTGVHSGKSNYGFRIGGLYKLFGLINSCINRYDAVGVTFDNTKILKKETFPFYKAGRPPQYDVYAQIAFAKELLTMCGIPYLEKEGYEADDIIYSFSFDISRIDPYAHIFIFSDDHDIASCVTDCISTVPVASGGKAIEYSTYNQILDVPFPCITLSKVFTGDASDGYPALKTKSITFDQLHKIYDDTFFTAVNDGKLSPLVYSNYNIFCKVIDQLNLPDAEEIKKHARLAFPYELQVTDKSVQELFSILDAGAVSWDIVSQYYPVIHSSSKYNRELFLDILYTLGIIRGRDTNTELVELFKLRGSQLIDGEFLASHPHKVQATYDGNSLLNMELPI